MYSIPRILKAILLLICMKNIIFFISFYDIYDIINCDKIFLKYFLSTYYYCATINNYYIILLKSRYLLITTFLFLRDK